MARRHVLGDGGVSMVATGTQMSGDPLALQKDLHGTRRQPHLDLAAGEAIGNTVEMALELDMVVDADPAHAPFGEGEGSLGNGLRWGRSSSSSRARRVTPSRRIGRSSLSCRNNSPIAVLSSAKL